jgi:hypothetical protein
MEETMDEKMNVKKPYAAPTVTEHGNAVKKTRGIGGKYWEPMINQSWPVTEEDLGKNP